MSDYLILVPVLVSLFIHLVALFSLTVIAFALSYYNLFFFKKKKEHVEGKPNMNCERTLSSKGGVSFVSDNRQVTKLHPEMVFNQLIYGED